MAKRVGRLLRAMERGHCPHGFSYKHYETMEALDIIQKYYPFDSALRQLLLHHSRQVALRALDIARRHPELGLDAAFLEQAAMVHDVGIFLCNAPGIGCHGPAPYLMHGPLGAALLRQEGLESLARVCERHTGTGLTALEIERRGLPLPVADLLPETLEEQVVCYADKFFSKSHPERVRTVEQTAASLEKFGPEGVAKFMGWAERFE